MQVLTMKSHST